jgi:hypothetical protein
MSEVICKPKTESSLDCLMFDCLIHIALTVLYIIHVALTVLYFYCLVNIANREGREGGVEVGNGRGAAEPRASLRERCAQVLAFIVRCLAFGVCRSVYSESHARPKR